MIDKITGNVSLSDEKIQELRAQVGIYFNHANGYHQGEMGVKTRMAWEYYYGRLPEPITQGSSQWVDRSVWDAVNGTLQELISVFTSGEDTVRFSPINHADADAARAATKMVNQVLLRDNQGYNVLHDAFKECLVARNSFVKRYWTTESKFVTETFEDLTQKEFDMYMTQLDGEIVKMDAEEDEKDSISGEVTYETKREGVKVEYVPFEQVVVEPTATSLKDCNYIAHRVRKTKDELYQMDFNKELVESLQPASSDIEAGVIANARVNNLSPLNVSDVLAVGDDRADKLWLHEHYIKTSCVTGRMEIIQVFTIHGQILEVNRVDEMPFETSTPFPVPGTIWGESVFDITKDIQDLKTTLIRGVIDNTMNANFRRYIALEKAYDRKSLLDNRPGGVVEVKQLDAVTPFPYHQLPTGIFDIIGYIDGVKEERTGVSKIGQGLDPAVFKNDNSFATTQMVMSAAQNRLRMVARNIAQRFIMELMLSIYNLIRQNGTEIVSVETANGPAEINPKEMPPRRDMIVAVAVGDAERKERAQGLQSAMMMMTQVPQMQTFFLPNNAYHMASEIFQSMGVYDVQNYITPLDQIPPPEPDPAQEIQLQMLQEQLKALQTQTQKLVADVSREDRKLEFEQTKAADEVHMRREEAMSRQDEMADKMSVEERKLQIKEAELELERQKLILESQIEIEQGRGVSIGR
ncbi:MAG: cell envelope integrity protein TolA [Bacteroidales bacterium]